MLVPHLTFYLPNRGGLASRPRLGVQAAHVPATAGAALNKCDAHARVCSPHDTARPAHAVKNELEPDGHAYGRGDLNAGARVRNVADDAFELWRFVAENNEPGL
jgi:hypothetical protein